MEPVMPIPRRRLATHTLAVSPEESLQPLSHVVLGDLERTADRLMHVIIKREPAYAGLSGTARESVRNSIHDNLELGIRSLTRTLPESANPVATARETGRLRAVQNIPLEAVLRAYRLGGRTIWDALLSASRQQFSGKYDSALLDAVSHWWRSIDDSASALVDAYQLEEAKRSSRKVLRTHVFLTALLEGRCADPTFIREAAAALTLPENGPLLCVVARLDSSPEEALRSPHSALLAHGIDSSWLFRPSEVIGVLALGNRTPDAVLEILAPTVAVPTGVSPVSDGLVGIRTAYEFARTAARTQECPGLISLDDRLPEALLISSPELARRLPEVALGDLLHVSAREQRTLLGTLDALLTCNGSATHAAQRVYCHRNTILYRLHRIETATGRTLSDSRDRLVLRLGLMALQAEPAAVS